MHGFNIQQLYIFWRLCRHRSLGHFSLHFTLLLLLLLILFFCVNIGNTQEYYRRIVFAVRNSWNINKHISIHKICNNIWKSRIIKHGTNRIAIKLIDHWFMESDNGPGISKAEKRTFRWAHRNLFAINLAQKIIITIIKAIRTFWTCITN